MKKFISMVMAAAMVVSLVPATAFAATHELTAKAKVYKVAELTEDRYNGFITDGKNAELNIEITDDDYTTGGLTDVEFTLTLDNAEFLSRTGASAPTGGGAGDDRAVPATVAGYKGMIWDINVLKANGTGMGAYGANIDAAGNKYSEANKYELEVTMEDTDEMKVHYVSKATEYNLVEDCKIVVSLPVQVDNTSAGRQATVSIESDDLNLNVDDLVFVDYKDFGITATLKKVAEVAEEEEVKLEKDLKIESDVEDFVNGQVITITVSKGFEISAKPAGWNYVDSDKDEITYTCNGTEKDEITIKAADLKIEAVDAKVGDVAKLTVKAKKGTDGEGFKATAAAVEAVKVVGETVALEVDEDDDVPVIYSGVNVNNDGITDDSDHMSLEVTIKESVKGALDVKKAFTLGLPEGVYVTDVNVTGKDGVKVAGTIEEAFEQAYEDGDHEGFKFARKTFTATDDASVNEEMELKFELELIAEPGFEGDVTLTLGGDAFENEAEVVIAKFVAPYTVEAAQNDLIIDYRNTEVPTDVVVKEAEAGLWSAKSGEEMTFIFDIDKMEFENDATITVDGDSDMEVKAVKGYDLGFKVTEESGDEAAVITLSDISLYMGRSLAAGAYDLDLWTNAGQWMLTTNELFTTDSGEITGKYYAADAIDLDYNTTSSKWDDQYYTVKEGFVNVITAGRDQDDASFTKKVVVPVGENYIVAGEETVALDVPAYISAAGYTMLPVRAVAVALGINNNNVLWDQATKTVTILYGQRIITMVAGQKVVYVNGSAIPASASVEIKDGRTFLPMRDLATALGVTDITWDAATKTATLNGNK